MSRKPPSHQARVDDIVAEIRTGQPGPHHVRPAARTYGAGSLEAELAQLRVDLSGLGGKLANDPALIAAHPEIQMLDVSVQRIDRMIGQLNGDGQPAADG
jgi:hypothetical protein